ncbi:MAG: NAD(P)H-hydrate dehydratase [Eubacteriales bacterium]|nr:NAD(P)H-hydrate dehydratase [Eubacteriales bacterium]MDD3882394.1 NAD(P)H-hydrate dehydratase [Eubacteriales bacterium]MDD4512385.1 NAD(P)H-hydrate dehydratase [Eubacteriales bacterium]
MQKTITPEKMRSTEKNAFAAGKSSLSAMKCAARGLSKAVFAYVKFGLAVFICGGGGNGGDGFYAAKTHIENGGEALVYYFKEPSGDSLECYRELKTMTHAENLRLISKASELQIPKRAMAIVDCLFGTGLSGEVSGSYPEIIEKINSCGIYVISCDIPSGLSGLTGLPLGSAVIADETITFHRPKQGLYLARGREFSGKVSVCPLETRGLMTSGGYNVLESSDIARLIPKRKESAHKGDAGKLLIIGGSYGMAGAAALCGGAAFRTGAGLVRILTEPPALSAVQALCPCATAAEISAKSVEEGLLWADAIAIGTGLGMKKSIYDTALPALLSEKPKVVDADALNQLAANPQRLNNAVITPHIGEAARLFAAHGKALSGETVNDCKTLSELYGSAALLKGHSSVVYDSGETYINISGCAGMAVGGSGDVLTGIIGALLADRETNFGVGIAAALGALIHGLAGENAAGRIGTRSMTAMDELDGISAVLSALGR